jgi:hypothetical protein
MAKRRDIVITIGPDGQVQIKVEGIGGPDCVDFTKFLEEELGEVTERTYTGEYFQEGETETTIKVGGES